MGRNPTVMPRTSQRQPRACQECTRRKIRCDKRDPCTRCSKRALPCTRELVRSSKAGTLHRHEIEFLRSLHGRLSESRDMDVAISSIQQRLRVLEYGSLDDHDSRAKAEPRNQEDSINTILHRISSSSVRDPITSETENLEETEERVSEPPPSATTPLSGLPESTTPDLRHLEHHSTVGPRSVLDSKDCASKIQALEFLAWGRHTGTCFPHRSGCQCRSVRPYAEIASINTDMNWTGLQRTHLTSQLPRTQQLSSPVVWDLPTDQAKVLIHFHLDHILWHHNVFHAPTFLAQCEEFWSNGTVYHPLWAALYLSVLTVSMWTAINCKSFSHGILDVKMIRRFFRAMVQTLYDENFLENLSLFSIQAITLSTRIAHNLDMSDLNATLVGAAIRIAHCLGIHQIAQHKATPNRIDYGTQEWYHAVETEVGKRCWLQLIIQDWFQIPFTETYMINPSHFETDLPINCHDGDMIKQDDGKTTINSYIRVLARIAALMPSLHDGLRLGSERSQGSLIETHKHVSSMYQSLRAVIGDVPKFFLQKEHSQNSGGERATPGWLPIARHSLALSTADKIIMIHRPILFLSFQIPALARPRAICVSAAMTILREHEAISRNEEAVSLWTHSAFCVTAAMVIGFELLFREAHIDADSLLLRSTLADTATRLKLRKCDVIAERGAALIATMLEVEEQLVLEVMRHSLQGSSIKEAQLRVANAMIEDNVIISKFLVLSPILKDRSELFSETYHGSGEELQTSLWNFDGAFVGEANEQMDDWFSQMSSHWNTASWAL